MRNSTTNIVTVVFINDCFIGMVNMVRNVVAAIQATSLRFLGSRSESKRAKRRAAAAAWQHHAHWHLPSAGGGYRLTTLPAQVRLCTSGPGCSQRHETSLRNSAN
jgi:hypothetical protein